MIKYNFLNELNLSSDVIKKVTSNLINIERGKTDVLTSPIAIRNSPDTILSEWDTIFESNSVKMNDALIKLEVSNRSKFGPRSIAIPWKDRKAGVLEYFSSEDIRKSFTLPKVTKNARRNLRPKDLHSSIKLLKNNTNSGIPYYTRKGLVKDRTFQNFDYLLNRKDPCVMFTRTQEQNKTRTVWGYPMSDTLNEMRFYGPLLDYQRKLNWRSSIVSPDAVNIKMTHLINKAKSSGSKLLSIDFSAYDQTLKSSLQGYAFDYIKSLFQPQYEEEINYIADRFNKIGIITPDGILSGPHGVPSGSTFTNEVDSICQYLIATKFGLDSDNFDIQGDDGAYCLDSPEELMSTFRGYGLSVNEEKSYTADNYLIYLQNLFHSDYPNDEGIIGGIYPTYRALNRIIFLERFTDFESDEIRGSDYFSIRTICILENCKYHPLFEDLVKFVLSLDKYSLHYSNEGLDKFVKRFNQASGVQGVLNFRYEDNPGGINNFETVKLIRKLQSP